MAQPEWMRRNRLLLMACASVSDQLERPHTDLMDPLLLLMIQDIDVLHRTGFWSNSVAYLCSYFLATALWVENEFGGVGAKTHRGLAPVNSQLPTSDISNLSFACSIRLHHCHCHSGRIVLLPSLHDRGSMQCSG